MFFFIVIMIPLLLVGFISDYMMKGALSNQVQTSYMEIVKQVCEVTDISMEEVERKLKAGSSDSRLWAALGSRAGKSPITEYEDAGYIQSFLHSLYANDRTFEGAGIITEYGAYGNLFSKVYLNQNDFFKTPLYKAVHNADGGVVWEGAHEDTFGSRRIVITAARLEKHGGSGQQLGVSVVNIKPEFFKNILSKVSTVDTDSIKLFIAEPDMRVVAGIGDDSLEGFVFSDSDLVEEMNKEYKKTDEGFFYYKDSLMFFDTISLTGWRIIAVVKDEIIMKPVQEVRMQVFWIAFISIAISFMLALSMAKNVTEPIKSIVNVMKKAEKGDLDAKCEDYGNYEMSFLSRSFNNMMNEVKKSKNELEKLNKDLEQRVEERTSQLKIANEELIQLNNQLNDYARDQQEKNIELEQALDTIRETQKHLVESEKMAALGNMVAGVAHEINTPVGVSVTAVTYLLEKTKEIEKSYITNQLKKSVLEKYIKVAVESASAAYSNLQKASNLIKSFKRVSADTTNEEKTIFNVSEYLNNIVIALSPEFKGKDYNIVIQCDKDIEMFSYPGSLSQIFTNLIMNSVIHGFEKGSKGNIKIDVFKEDNKIIFEYSDDGKGIPESIRERIFDMFFTTKRSDGGTGLGLNIVYNIVTQNLGGYIKVISEVGKGTSFVIEIPVLG